MKKGTIFFFLQLLLLSIYSCHSKTDSNNNIPTQFHLEDSLVQTNTYTPTGLLDSSYSISYNFFKDSLYMIIHSYTTRKYNAINQLICEQEYDKDEDGKEYSLYSQVLYRYNKKAQLVKQINMLGNIIFSINSFEYNGSDSLSKETYIVQNMDDAAPHSMMENMIHSTSITYDTITRIYNYDSSGKLIKNNTAPGITKTSINIGNNEKLDIKIHNNQTDYYIDSSWIKDNILAKQVYMEEYTKCTCRTCTYYNKKGDEIKMLKYRLLKD